MSMWMQDGCKVYMDSYVASNGSCFMVTWTFSKMHLSEVGLIQYRETTALQMLTTVDLFCFIMWGPARIFYFKKIAFGWGLGPILLHTTLEDPWAHYMILEVSWEGIWALSFGFSQFHGHGSWLLCEVALRVTSHTRWRACDHCVLQSLSGRIGRDCPSSLHTRRWRPKGPNKLSWMKYMVDYKYCFMVWQKLHHAHLQKVGLTQMLTYHIGGTTFEWYNIGPS